MIFKNPVFVRYCRSELRFRKAIFWYLLTLITCAFTVAIIYVPQIVRDRDPVEAARGALLPILIIQGIILLFMGTGSVASGITREKVENVLDYQRLTPLPVRDKILGYLFGLPVREYILFLITLPFAAFILIAGKIPPSAFVPYYLVFLTSTLLYHFTGLVAGMISRKWRWSARITQGLIILLYFVLPQLSHLGLVFMEFLTVRPVFVERILPLIQPGSTIRIEAGGLLAGQSVPFFTVMVSGTLFSLIIQALLIILFARIASRKWQSDSRPAFSKPMAVITYLGFLLMALGNIWPNLTRSTNALAIFQSDGDLPQQVALFFLPLILSLAATTLAFILMVSALPEPMAWRQGRIRAARRGHDRLGHWEDDASGALLTTLFALAQAGLIGIALATLHRAGYFESLESNPWRGLVLVLSAGLCLAYFQALKERYGTAQLGLIALIHWMVPLLAAVLVIAIDDRLGGTSLLIASLSPLTLLPLGAGLLLPPENFGEQIPQVHRALGLGLLVLVGITAFLQLALRKTRQGEP
jgi:hypothetical protein